MPLKDLFTSKTNKLRPDPRIRWFGKLPTYPDYYNSGTDEAWTVEFSEWVLKGFELYRSRIAGSGKPRERLPVAACALRLPRSRMTVFVSVLDYGGDLRGRPFPMCFYAGVPSASWPGPTSDRVVPAARVIRDLIALRREVPRFLNSPGRFEATFGEREVDLAGVCGGSSDESWLSAGKEMPFGEWFGKTRGGLSAGDWEAWERAVACWGENLAKHTGSRFEATVILPLVMGSFLDAQIAGWIHWLERRFDLRHKFLSLVVVGGLWERHQDGRLAGHGHFCQRGGAGPAHQQISGGKLLGYDFKERTNVCIHPHCLVRLLDSRVVAFSGLVNHLQVRKLRFQDG